MRMNLAHFHRIQECFSRLMLLGIIYFALGAVNARAAELVMFERAGCAWCEAFDRDIAPIYGKTDEGLRTPLRRVDTARPIPPNGRRRSSCWSTGAAKSGAFAVIQATNSSGACSARW
jgi:hypothetical protein